MATTKDILIKIKDLLTELLIDDLGIYEFLVNGVVVAESPSIEIRYPMLENQAQKRIKAKSGIECIINTDINIEAYGMQKAYQTINYFEIILDQYAPLKCLDKAIKKILSCPFFDISSSPIIRSSMLLDEGGIIPPRAILYLRQAEYIARVF